MPAKVYRIGQIVPSSNTTMETEIPAMLMARQGIEPERFTSGLLGLSRRIVFLFAWASMKS